MQTLQIMVRGEDGKERFQHVKVYRSWADASGAEIFLHANGTYGYKDGSPVVSESELRAVITAPAQLNLALSWWKRVGREQSEKFYAARQVQMEKLAAEGVLQPAQGDVTALDQVLYVVATVSEGPPSFGAPLPWMELFERRPDWWGHADRLQMAGMLYLRADLAELSDALQGAEHAIAAQSEGAQAIFIPDSASKAGNVMDPAAARAKFDAALAEAEKSRPAPARPEDNDKPKGKSKKEPAAAEDF